MKITIKRAAAGSGEPPVWVTHEVPEFEGMTVLDALMWLREHIDPSISMRFSCRNANACKECVALINGRMTYLCTCPAKGEVEVQPLPNKSLLRDLAVEP